MAVLQLNFLFIKMFKIPTCCYRKLSICYMSHKKHGNYSCANFEAPNIPHDKDNVKKNNTQNVFAKVNKQIVQNTHGRLFAVVRILGLQYKITTEDILVIRHHWPPNIGDQIRLEKVLLVGSANFTLLGTPLLPLDQVSVHATVIEKTFTHSYPLFYFKRRKNFQVLNFFKDELTYLRINAIKLIGEVNKLGDVDGFKDRIF